MFLIKSLLEIYNEKFFLEKTFLENETFLQSEYLS